MNDFVYPQKLWNKNFTLFLISTIQASFGSAISGVALAFLVLKLTKSPSAMAITLALKFLPAIFTPIIATFVDRMRLKPPLIIGNFLRGSALIGLFIGIRFGLFHIYAVYIVALFNGIIATIYAPAAQSLIPNLIPKNQLARGNSLLAMANQGMVLVGLAFGGLMVGVLGPALSLFIEGMSYFGVGIVLFFVCMPIFIHSDSKSSFWKDFRLGLEMIKTSHIIMLIMITAFFLNAIMSPLEVLLPIHMTEIGKGAIGYGFFMMLIIGGMLIGNAVIMVLGKIFNSLHGIVVGWFGVSIALAGLGIFNAFYFSLLWAFLLGLNLAILNTGTTVILQKIVPAEFRGRIFGVMGAAGQMGIPISLFILSYVVKKVTLTEIFIGAMIASVIFAVVWVWFTKGNQVNLDKIQSF